MNLNKKCSMTLILCVTYNQFFMLFGSPLPTARQLIQQKELHYEVVKSCMLLLAASLTPLFADKIVELLVYQQKLGGPSVAEAIFVKVLSRVVMTALGLQGVLKCISALMVLQRQGEQSIPLEAIPT